MKHGKAEQQREYEKVVALWLNSTLGLLTIIAARIDTRGPWIQMKKPLLLSLPVVDPTRLTETQRARLVELYGALAKLPMRRPPDIANDPVRAQIDAAIAEALRLDVDFGVLREMLSREQILLPAPTAAAAREAAAADRPEQLPLIPATGRSETADTSVDSARDGAPTGSSRPGELNLIQLPAERRPGHAPVGALGNVAVLRPPPLDRLEHAPASRDQLRGVRRRQPQHDVVLMQRLVQKAKAEAWLGTTSVQVNSSSASG